MKTKIRKEIGLVLMIGLLLTGCKKAPINEKIEGHWSVQSITTLENGETTYPYRLYYSIGRTLTQLDEKQGNQDLGIYIGRTEYRDHESILVLKDFLVKVDRGDQGEKATREQLEPFGIVTPEETVFSVVKSTRNVLILESDWARIELESF